MKIKNIAACCLLWLAAASLCAQGGVYMDKDGVLRREDTKEEASFYGVNYTLPFAHAYRAVHQPG